MKRSILTLALIFWAVAGTWAQSADVGSSPAPSAKDSLVAAPVVIQGASIQFEETKYDFGKIKQGEVVEHTFKFTNNGTQPLLISKVRTTCGCTATDYPKAPVMPGETAAITAVFSSAGKKGPQNKVITVESNAVQGSTQVMIVTTIEATH